MYTINLEKVKFEYSNETKTFKVSEREVPFGMEYTIFNPKTNTAKIFVFSHSTGPEFDPATEWIYKNVEGFILAVCNEYK